MNFINKLYEIFEMYEQDSYDYKLKLANTAFNVVFNRISSTKGKEYAMNYISILCSTISASDGEPNQTEFDFFMKAIDGKFNWNYQGWCDVGLRTNQPKYHDMLVYNRDIAEREFYDDYFNLQLFVLSLTMCSCDGNFTQAEKNFVLDYVPFPKSLMK